MRRHLLNLGLAIVAVLLLVVGIADAAALPSQAARADVAISAPVAALHADAHVVVTPHAKAATHPMSWVWGGASGTTRTYYCHVNPWELDDPDSGAKMVFQGSDCNYVLYANGGPVWASGTANKVGTGGYLRFWQNGAIAIYNSTGQKIWGIFSVGGQLPYEFQFLPTRCGGKAGFASFSIANDFTPSYSWDPRQLDGNPIYT